MERVHFHQEQMLPELKELEEKGIFSQVRQTSLPGFIYLTAVDRDSGDIEATDGV